MQIHALGEVVSKEAIIKAQSNTNSINNLTTETETTTNNNSSSRYDWLDETYNLLFGTSSTSSARAKTDTDTNTVKSSVLSGINWGKWSSYSHLKNLDATSTASSLSRSSIPTGLDVSLSAWENITTSMGYRYNDIPSGLAGSTSDLKNWIKSNCSTVSSLIN